MYFNTHCNFSYLYLAKKIYILIYLPNKKVPGIGILITNDHPILFRVFIKGGS